MKLRKSGIEITDAAEREAVEAVRRRAAGTASDELQTPSPTYFSNLIVKTNRKIDHVTSGRALSISWLARVAVPGIVAILFFSIGLHYYRPGIRSPSHSIADALRTLPSGVLDSLLFESFAAAGSMASEIPANVFEVSNIQLAEFYLTSGTPMSVLEALPEQQVKEVASILESRSTNL